MTLARYSLIITLLKRNNANLIGELKMNEFYYNLNKSVEENAELIKSHFTHLEGSSPINLALWMNSKGFYSITYSELETLEGSVV